MATTLILLCAAATRMSRQGGFPAPEEALDEGGRRAAARCTLDGRFHADVFFGPTLAAKETAQTMRLSGHETAELADIDCGPWTGRTFEAIHGEAPDDFARWLAGSVSGVPGGEPMEAVQRRVGAFIDRAAALDRPICAITHATVIRAAMAHALDLPARSTLAIDIAPLSRAILSFNRVWRLQALVPLD